MKTFFIIVCTMFLTTFILSLNVSGSPLFTSVYRLFSPLSSATQELGQKVITKSWKETKKAGAKLIENAKPPGKSGTIQGETTVEDSEELNDLIKSY
jgi:hypothetical protein